jgi:redox-sensitive bicupin YhaK (pirin superfamily)
MKTKSIKQIYTGTSPHMVGDGFRVANYIPGVNNYAGNELSPFIMFDYNAPHYFPPTANRRGVGEHPHRGFETVSIAYEGEIEHRDSHGGGGVINAGDIQWMTAAGGLMHDEFQTENFAKNGGTQHFIQLWVNLPAKNKMDKPHYQAITKAQINEYKVDETGSVVRVMAGNFKGVKGAASTYTPINMYDMRLNKNAKVSFDVSEMHNAMLLVTKGNVTVNESQAAKHMDFIVFKNEGETITIEANEDSMVFFISGQPINEPLARYGPFVMNTREEIIQAMDDVNAGKFGSIA